MRIADFFTVLRIALAPIFFCLFFLPSWTGWGAQLSAYILIPLFVFMEFTDFLDGHFARKLDAVSDFGKLFDPFADVLANLTALFAFVISGYLHPVLFLLILYREMGIMFVRSLASRRGVAMGARKGGKAKTVLYIVAAGASLLLECAPRLSVDLGFFGHVVAIVNLPLYILAVVVSLASFVDYVLQYRSLSRA